MKRFGVDRNTGLRAPMAELCPTPPTKLENSSLRAENTGSRLRLHAYRAATARFSPPISSSHPAKLC